MNCELEPDGGEAQRRGAAVEQRRVAAVAGGEIGCGGGAEERLEVL